MQSAKKTSTQRDKN